MDINKILAESHGLKRQKTALEQFKKNVEQYLAPLRQFEEMHDLIRKSSPGYQIQEMFKQYESNYQIQKAVSQLRLSRNVQELLDSVSIGVQAQGILKKNFALDPLIWKQVALSRAAGFDSLSETVTAFERLFMPVIKHQEWVEKLQNQTLGGLSMRDFALHLENTNSALSVISATNRSFNNILDSFRDTDLGNFKLDAETEYEADQIVQAIAQATTTEPALQATVEQFVKVIQAQQNPSMQLMLWIVFKKVMDWIIAGIIGTVISQYMPKINPQSPQEATKSVKEVARLAGATQNLLVEYRFVSAKVVILRQNPKARSPEVGRLNFGKPVKLLRKNKHFALVLWRDQDSGSEIQGWVYSRYLQKFQ